jgi:hypothetical protein
VDPIGGYYFVIDDLVAQSSQPVSFSYILRYAGAQTTNIAIDDIDKDGYLDIRQMPADGCSRYYRSYINTRSLLSRYRAYTA